MDETEIFPRTRAVRLILASRSPRRRELLAEAGYQFEVILPSEEVEATGQELARDESPADLAARLARQKAADVVQRLADMGLPSGRSLKPTGSPNPSPVTPKETALPHAIVIGGDTVVECRGQILGKPTDREHARQILQTLSGQEHRVYTGLCLWPVPGGQPRVQTAVSRLRMDPLRPDQLEEYLHSGQWEGKAGAFGYQDRLGWVHLLEGSESNVVGLPLELLARMLAEISGSPIP
jgi:septum formation protein